MQTLRVDVQQLDLSDNELCLFTIEQWRSLAKALQGVGIQQLNLSGNLLYKLRVKRRQSLGEMLKRAGIQQLDLNDNNITGLSGTEKLAFYQMLRTAGVLEAKLEMAKELPLDYEYWLVMLQNNFEAAFNRLGQGRHLEDIPYLLAEQNFSWPVAMSDEILTQFIKRLEASNQPQDKLIAGLLLLGYGNNFMAYDNPAYWEKRIHDGISLLLQAVNTGLSLGREVNHLLWHLKVTLAEDFPSVAKRLGELWLRPLARSYDYFNAQSTYPLFSLPSPQEYKLVRQAERGREPSPSPTPT